MRDDRMEAPRSGADGPGTEEARTSAPDAPTAGADAQGGAGEGGGAAAAGSRGAEVDAELQSMRDRHLRLAAEYDNYRKRTERERADLWARAQAQLVERLLDALDDLQRVAHHATETATAESLLEGVQMVERKLLRALENAGLEVVEAEGQPFNPAEHEALMTAATEKREEDETVGQVFQKGYRFRGELLRPARVQVRKHEG